MLPLVSFAVISSWPGVVPAIYVLANAMKTWMPGTRPGMTKNDIAVCDLHQAAVRGDTAQVIFGIAKRVFDHGQALEVVADLGLHGHADAAM